MNNNNKAPKERTNSVNRHQATCTRTDRDMYRICPAKLSRRELENLYFSLLENNVDLKKNLNLQQEKIKNLSVKVQRMSYPRNTNGTGKDSPVTLAIVNDQKDSIIKLKRANECMMERIRVLNMKLNSLKQFAGKPKASNLNNVTLSSSNTKSNCTPSCSNLHKAGPSQVKTNTVGTQTDFFAEKCSNSSCDIKCKPTMDELNVKINNLQEELQTSRQRIEKLEALVMRLQGENQTVRAERAASEHVLKQLDASLDEQKEKLRCAEAKVNDLNMELTIEKKKLAELETELKLGGNIMSSSAAKTIEELEQKKVGREANELTDEGKLIRDEANVASDARAEDKVQFNGGEAINVGRNNVNRVPNDTGGVMASNEMDTETDNKIYTRGEIDVARNGVNRVPDDIEYNWGDFMTGTQVDLVPDDKRLNNDELNVPRNEIKSDKKSIDENNLTRNEVDKVPNDIILPRSEEVSKNEYSMVSDDKPFSRGEVIDMTRNDVNREPDKVEYDWGDFVAKSNVGTVPDVIILSKKGSNSSKAKNEGKKIPDENEKEMTGDKVNIARDEVKKEPDDVELTTAQKNLAKNEVNKVPSDVDYNRGEKITNNEVNVQRIEENKPRIEVNNEKDEVKSLRDEVKDDLGNREEQELNKDTETEKDQQNIKINQELMNKISELVSQLEMLKITAAGEAYTVTDKIVKEKPTKLKSHVVKTKKPDAISFPANKQKLTQKSYNDKTKETDNTSSQAKKEKPMQIKLYEAKPKKANRISHLINKPNLTQNKSHDVKTKKAFSSNSLNKLKPTQQSYDDKTKKTDITGSQINKKNENQYKTYDGKTEASDNISMRVDKDQPKKYESNDVKTEVDDILIRNNIDKETMYRSMKDSDIDEKQMEKQAEYESIKDATNDADKISINIGNAISPKCESYDIKTKESDDTDPRTHYDRKEFILEVKPANERNQLKIQEPVSINELKAMSRDTEQKPIINRTIPEEFDLSHQQSIEKLSTVSAIAQELKSNIIPKSSRSDDDARYQIPGPISVDFYDQNREVSGEPYFRKSIDNTPEKNTDSYKPNKMSYVEISKQIGSISESPLKNIIDAKSAKSKDSYGESLRKRSLEEKSEKIRKTFGESPNRNSFQQSSDDNIKRKPFRDLTARQSFDDKLMQISDTDGGERPAKKSKDPLRTGPSFSLSERTARMSLDDSSKEILPFDDQPRLSLSPKAALIIKDYARDIEAKSRKVKQRFSTPCATVIKLDPSRIWQPTESILKSEAATSSPCVRASGVNDGPSTSYQLNMDVDGNAAPTVGGQENAGTEPATTAAHMRDVDEPFEICGASAKVCVCPPLELRSPSAFRTCTGNICFRTTHPKDNIRHCACATALDHNCDVGPSSRRESSTSMENKAPRTYSVAGEHSRAASPDNTEHEISCMTDFASEKDGLPERSPDISLEARARICSLSEERGTTTSTDVPSNYYTTASEGEVPGELSSLGKRDPGLGPYEGLRESIKTDTMEATLQTIGEELARCRKLLLSQRDQERDKSVENVLRPSPASRQLSATYTPICVFTLHIGTLVLSDETVVWSRDKNLVLTWKFYSQSVTMTRVAPGRVAVFQFVTEYDVVFNDHLVNYMKNSDMPIVLSELGKEDKPFAKCWLPLQEALLHANRRADMSLALVPCQSEDIGDRQSFGEVGVLDIWCSLRLDNDLLSVINRALHKPTNNGPAWHSAPAGARESRIIQQAAEDEPSGDSNHSRQSRDLGLSKQSHDFGLGSQSRDSGQGRQSQHNSRPSTTLETPPRSYSGYPTRTFNTNFYVPTQNIPGRASERYAEETQEQHKWSQQLPKYSFHSFSSPAQKAQLDYGERGRGGYARWSAPEHRASEIIINEVPASIRTENDMREALEKVRQENTRWPTTDEHVNSLKNASFESGKSLIPRHQSVRLKSPQMHKPEDLATESYQDILNKDKQNTPNTVEGSDPNFSSSTNAYKYIGAPGSNKLAEGSRRSVKYSNSVEREYPKPSTTAGPPHQSIDITILWVALNEECEAMANPNIKRLYVAYSFLGRSGADLETPFSLPKPKHYADKCYFNFKKTFKLYEADLPVLGHMARCRSGGDETTPPRDCVVFTLVSEPPEDPLGLSSCEDVGYAYLYLGDVLAYSGGSNGYTEVLGVRGVRGGVCGVLAVRVDNLAVLRLCLTLRP